MATAKVLGKERMDSIDRKILVVVQEERTFAGEPRLAISNLS